jgi:hypothetical protein
MMLLLLDLSFRLGVEVAVGGGVFGTTLIFGFWKKHGLAVVNESRFSFHFFVSAR